MEFVLRMVLTVLSLGFVVVFHEWGHFLVARRLGVRVEKFTVGFGPEIFGWTRGDTRYALCIVPLGGMVKLAGEAPEESTHKPDEFFSQPWYGRAGIALAGPVMNYALAFILFALVAWKWGVLKPSDQAIIGDMVVGLPAYEAKLEINDLVKSIDGVSIASWEELAKYIHDRPEKKLRLQVERTDDKGQTKLLAIALTPQRDTQRNIGLIGIVPKVNKVDVGVRGSVKAAWRDIKIWTLQPITYLSAKIRHFEGPKELSGPIGIAQMVTKATKEGFSYVLYLMAIISTGLGLFNLFPIPILDGGHIFLYTIEGIIRRPLSQKTMQVANAIGLSIVLTIFLYASYQDILRLRLGFMK